MKLDRMNIPILKDIWWSTSSAITLLSGKVHHQSLYSSSDEDEEEYSEFDSRCDSEVFSPDLQSFQTILSVTGLKRFYVNRFTVCQYDCK